MARTRLGKTSPSALLKVPSSAWLRPPPLTEPEENALVCEPTVRMMGTVGVATFKDVCDYMSASFNVKRAKILFWKYSLIFEITTPFDKDFDV